MSPNTQWAIVILLAGVVFALFCVVWALGHVVERLFDLNNTLKATKAKQAESIRSF